MSTRIYLDHNATTPLRPEAAAAIGEAMHTCGNPSSVHAAGRRARGIIEDAREEVGAGRSNARRGGLHRRRHRSQCAGAARRWPAATSAVEHASSPPRPTSAQRSRLIVTGIVHLDALDALLAAAAEPALVSVMAANNETRVIKPIAEVAAVCRALLPHCDAARRGRIPLGLPGDGRPTAVHVGAQAPGPAVGALVVDASLPLQPLLRGGGQERGRRAGTENLLGIAGFGAAAARASTLPDAARLTLLRDRLERRLRAVCPSAQVFGATTPRLPNTTCIAMPGVAAETQVIAFDLAGIAVSAGAACSSGRVARSDVLAAMGVGDDLASSALRVSLGWTTGEADVEQFLEVWISIYARMADRRPALAAGGTTTAIYGAVSER
ncbi:MAG: aminotransferase class V-fold PLP-dependent enzyme [Rhodospirillales bacterium]